MTDIYSTEKRSALMAKVHSQNTVAERLLRSALHRLGLRFRLNVRDLPGRPDIVLPRFRTVIFVHGCFWHRHARCKRASTPKSNPAFWREKFDANMDRDRRLISALKAAGWRALTAWECQILKDAAAHARRIKAQLQSVPRSPAAKAS
ncbi:MAG TPA: DNA mismatch endonuclease Vsr [Bryobacteraceae bacterium]